MIQGYLDRDRKTPPVTFLSLKFAPYALLLFFWSISIWNLSRFPAVLEDEPWILSPGYKLFRQGIFGSDMFSGFQHMDQIYLEFMPLMSLLQGATTFLFGVGVMQMRWLPVVLGTLTVAITFALARRCMNPSTGLLAIILLVFWQWTPSDQRMFGSGIPIIDVARIARYDILVTPLGLGAILVGWRTRSMAQARYDFLSGMLAGLAGLAHLYGLFWLVGLVILQLFAPGRVAIQQTTRKIVWMLWGTAVVWMIWGGVILLNRPYYLAQTAQNGDRFELSSPSFYRENLIKEPHRYHLGIRGSTTFRQIGFWLLVIGIPTALVWQGIESFRQRQPGVLWIWALSLLFPLLLALLIRIKTFSYLVSVVPLWAILLAWCMWRLYGVLPWTRPVMRVSLSLLVIQGSLGIVQMQWRASRAQAPERLFAELRQAIPPSGRILGPARYWLALNDRDYISMVMPFFLSDSKFSPTPVAFETAMDQIAPQFVLVDTNMAEFQDNYAPRQRRHAPNLIWTYLSQQNANLVRELDDNYGHPVKIYQVGIGNPPKETPSDVAVHNRSFTATPQVTQANGEDSSKQMEKDLARGSPNVFTDERTSP